MKQKYFNIIKSYKWLYSVSCERGTLIAGQVFGYLIKWLLVEDFLIMKMSSPFIVL